MRPAICQLRLLPPTSSSELWGTAWMWGCIGRVSCEGLLLGMNTVFKSDLSE